MQTRVVVIAAAVGTYTMHIQYIYSTYMVHIRYINGTNMGRPVCTLHRQPSKDDVIRTYQGTQMPALESGEHPLPWFCIASQTHVHWHEVNIAAKSQHQQNDVHLSAREKSLAKVVSKT